MRIVRALQVSLCAALLCATFAPGARADDWDRKTTVTFSNSVEIPGQVLPAGTYIFKLGDFADRHVVQIWNKNEGHVIATIKAIPIYRMEPPGKTIFQLKERPRDRAEAIRAWFYPGDACGNEFLYFGSRYRRFARTTATN